MTKTKCRMCDIISNTRICKLCEGYNKRIKSHCVCCDKSLRGDLSRVERYIKMGNFCLKCIAEANPESNRWKKYYQKRLKKALHGK